MFRFLFVLFVSTVSIARSPRVMDESLSTHVISENISKSSYLFFKSIKTSIHGPVEDFKTVFYFSYTFLR